MSLFDILIQGLNNKGFFYANQYSDQATEKDDLADEDHLSDTVGGDGKGNDIRWVHWINMLWTCMSILKLNWKRTPSNLLQSSCLILSIAGGRWKHRALGRLKTISLVLARLSVRWLVNAQAQAIHKKRLQKICSFYTLPPPCLLLSAFDLNLPRPPCRFSLWMSHNGSLWPCLGQVCRSRS